MTPQDFCYWLQGFFEMTDATELTPPQVAMIRDHLQLVFEKKTPNHRLDKFPDTTGRREPAPAPQSQVSEELQETLRQLEDARRKFSDIPLQQPPYISWKLPESPQCGVVVTPTVTASVDELVFDGSNWQPSSNPFIC